MLCPLQIEKFIFPLVVIQEFLSGFWSHSPSSLIPRFTLASLPTQLHLDRLVSFCFYTFIKNFFLSKIINKTVLSNIVIEYKYVRVKGLSNSTDIKDHLYAIWENEETELFLLQWSN